MSGTIMERLPIALRWTAAHSRFLLGALAVVGLCIALAGVGGSLDDVQRVGLVSGALTLALMTVAVLGVGVIWSFLVSSLSSASVLPGRLLRSFLVTWPARYVPGTIPYHAGRVLSAEQAGSTRPSVIAAIGYEAILQVGAAALLGVVCVAAASGIEQSAGNLYFLALAPLVALPILLQPAILLPTANVFLRVARRRTLNPGRVLSTARTTQALLGYAGVYALNGIAFYLVLRAIAQPDPNLILAIGTYSLGGAAGVLILFVPSGIGIREAVIVAMLSSSMPADQVLVAAGITRAVSVIGDLVPVCVIATTEAARRSLRLLSRPASSLPTH